MYCRQVLDELGLSHATDQDCSNVRYICECVSKRAAHLVSAGVATLINKMGQQNVTVGIDGSVYRFHPHFHDLMSEKIKQLVTPGIQVSSLEKNYLINLICIRHALYVTILPSIGILKYFRT
jgi:hexokinase